MYKLIAMLFIMLSLIGCAKREVITETQGTVVSMTPQENLFYIDEKGPFRGVCPDITWTGFFDNETSSLFFPGYDKNIGGFGTYFGPAGYRHGNKISLFGPVFTFDIITIETDDMGYQYVKNAPETIFTDGSRNDALVIISGGEWFVWRDYRSPDAEMYYIETNILKKIEERLKNEGKLDHYYDVGVVDDGIQTIRAWSELQETVRGEAKHYKAENMRHPFLLQTYDTYAVELNGKYPPWAEGDVGPGIGGKINIDFTRKVPSVYILNGYVDLRRRDLYKANNRLETVKVRSLKPAFEIEYTFPDYVGFHEIILPESTDSIELEIISVYRGDRFDDTCITKIFAPQKPLRTDEEKEADVREALAAYMKIVNRK